MSDFYNISSSDSDVEDDNETNELEQASDDPQRSDESNNFSIAPIPRFLTIRNHIIKMLLMVLSSEKLTTLDLFFGTAAPKEEKVSSKEGKSKAPSEPAICPLETLFGLLHSDSSSTRVFVLEFIQLYLQNTSTGHQIFSSDHGFHRLSTYLVQSMPTEEIFSVLFCVLLGKPTLSHVGYQDPSTSQLPLPVINSAGLLSSLSLHKLEMTAPPVARALFRVTSERSIRTADLASSPVPSTSGHHLDSAFLGKSHADLKIIEPGARTTILSLFANISRQTHQIDLPRSVSKTLHDLFLHSDSIKTIFLKHDLCRHLCSAIVGRLGALMAAASSPSTLDVIWSTLTDLISFSRGLRSSNARIRTSPRRDCST